MEVRRRKTKTLGSKHSSFVDNVTVDTTEKIIQEVVSK